MNSLIQLDSCLVGDTEAVETLSRKNTARILLLSDTHGHHSLFHQIVLKYGPECDALLFAGDGMWDVVRYLEDAHSDERCRNALPPVLAFVSGNCDSGSYCGCPGRADGDEPVCGTSGTFSLAVPPSQVIAACGHRIFLVHGNRHSVDVSPEILSGIARESSCDIAVFGHTHVPYAGESKRVFTVNPGSPARPRGYSAPGFAVLQLESGKNIPATQFYHL